MGLAEACKAWRCALGRRCGQNDQREKKKCEQANCWCAFGEPWGVEREGVCFEEGGRGGGGVDVKQDLVDGGKSFALLLPVCC